MPTAANARLDYEASQSLLAMAALTDSGDHQTFTSAAELWSQRAGYTPVLRPNGLVTGGLLTPSAGQNDRVDVAALTVQLQGLVLPVAASVGLSLTQGWARIPMSSTVSRSMPPGHWLYCPDWTALPSRKSGARPVVHR